MLISIILQVKSEESKLYVNLLDLGWIYDRNYDADEFIIFLKK